MAAPAPLYADSVNAVLGTHNAFFPPATGPGKIGDKTPMQRCLRS